MCRLLDSDWIVDWHFFFIGCVWVVLHSFYRLTGGQCCWWGLLLSCSWLASLRSAVCTRRAVTPNSPLPNHFQVSPEVCRPEENEFIRTCSVSFTLAHPDFVLSSTNLLVTSFPLTGTLKRRRAQQHASSQVQQSQHPHAHQHGHGGHVGQRQPQRQPQRQAQPQRHHRQPRENYQMGQMRRWDPTLRPSFPQCLGSSLCLQWETKASLHPKKSLTWLLVIIIYSICRQNRHLEKENAI